MGLGLRLWNAGLLDLEAAVCSLGFSVPCRSPSCAPLVLEPRFKVYGGVSYQIVGGSSPKP